jgi:hypothetical protein
MIMTIKMAIMEKEMIIIQIKVTIMDKTVMIKTRFNQNSFKDKKKEKTII